MSRTYSTITWGLALIMAAVVMNWTQSIPWTLTAAGAVAIIAGVSKALMDDEAVMRQAHGVGSEATPIL